MNDWSIFSSSPKPGIPVSSAEPELKEMAINLFRKKTELEKLSEEVKKLEGEIAYFFPQIAGEHKRRLDEVHVSVKRHERFEWDENKLAEIFDQREVPEYIRRRLSVDKRRFNRLSQDEQNLVKPALTRKLQSPKVEVTL